MLLSVCLLAFADLTSLQGLMGHGVAQVAAQAGFQVVAVETKQEALDVGMMR